MTNQEQITVKSAEELIERLADKNIKPVKFTKLDFQNFEGKYIKMPSAFELWLRKFENFPYGIQKVEHTINTKTDIPIGDVWTITPRNPVMIGDVLDYMWAAWKGAYNDRLLPLLDVWGKCKLKTNDRPLKQSLQEILEGAQKGFIGNTKENGCVEWESFIPNTPQYNLFKFLIDLGL